MLAVALNLITLLGGADDLLISELASDNKRSNAAYAALLNRGVEAFPALLERLDDKTVTQNSRFRGEVAMKDTDGNWVQAIPSIGHVAFDLIHNQIEGVWPKGLRKHYAITRTNVKEWLARHKGAELRRMRLLAATESLTSIAHDIADQGYTLGNQQCLKFLTKRFQAASIEITQYP